MNQGVFYRKKRDNSLNCGIYPNPATNEVRFTYSLPEGVNGIVKITDGLGRNVKEFDVTYLKKEHRFNIERMNQGIYFINMIASDGSHYEGKLTVIR